MVLLVWQKADNAGDSTEFVAFMLGMIRDALKELHENQNKTDGLNVVTNEDKVLSMLRQDGRLTSKVLASSLGLTQRQVSGYWRI